MIKFVDLRGLSYEGSLEFAFFNTTIDVFKEFILEQVWESREDFIAAYKSHGGDRAPLARYLKLLPDWVPEKEED